MTMCPKGGHDLPIEDDEGGYCEQHGVTLLWGRRYAPAAAALVPVPVAPVGARERPGYCAWHKGLSDTVVAVTSIERASGPPFTLYACRSCREERGLTPLGRPATT